MIPRSTDEREDIYKNYLLDLGRLIKEQARETKREKDCCPGTEQAFAEGKLMAYHEVTGKAKERRCRAEERRIKRGALILNHRLRSWIVVQM